jgi:hypothetical protein
MPLCPKQQLLLKFWQVSVGFNRQVGIYLPNEGDKFGFGFASLKLVHLVRDPFQVVRVSFLVGIPRHGVDVVERCVDAQPQLCSGVCASPLLQLPPFFKFSPQGAFAASSGRGFLEVTLLADSLQGRTCADQLGQARVFSAPTAHAVFDSLNRCICSACGVFVFCCRVGFSISGRFILCFGITANALLFRRLCGAFAATNTQTVGKSLLFALFPIFSRSIHALNEHDYSFSRRPWLGAPFFLLRLAVASLNHEGTRQWRSGISFATDKSKVQ